MKKSIIKWVGLCSLTFGLMVNLQYADNDYGIGSLSVGQKVYAQTSGNSGGGGYSGTGGTIGGANTGCYEIMLVNCPTSTPGSMSWNITLSIDALKNYLGNASVSFGYQSTGANQTTLSGGQRTICNSYAPSSTRMKGCVQLDCSGNSIQKNC